MYVVIRKYQTDPANVQTVMKSVREGFVPIISKIPGFVEYFGLDLGNGQSVFINVYEDKSHAEETIAEAAAYVREHLAPLLPNPPQVTEGEVTVHKAR